MFECRTFYGLAALILSIAAAIPLVLAHDSAKSERGKELFRTGREHATPLAESLASGRPPLYEGLGSLTMPITAANKEAQAYFDQGWRLTWAFNHGEAIRSFREAQRLDPQCAMCFWGEAFALGSNINDVMHEEAIAPAFEAIRKAQALKSGVTGKEQALIEALTKRYSASAKADRAMLDRAWAHAMEQVAQKYPDDVNILTLYADALMNLQPWDYWEAGGKTPKGRGGDIVAVLAKAIALDPGHPGAAHLYIHAVEASAHPEKAEAIADRLRVAMPAAGHLVHMPSHIYVRVGRFQEAIAANRDAVAADEAFLAQAGKAASSIYRFGYYPHNVHLLMISAQAAGAKEDVIAATEKLTAVTSGEASKDLVWLQAILTAPYSAHAQFSDPDVILALADPGGRLPFVKGFWHYARGVAYAYQGDIKAASAEAEAIGRLIADKGLSNLGAQNLPARDVLGIARYVVEARIEQAQGDYRGAEHHLREAIKLQDKVPYMEPPYWYYPVRQTLGAVLLQQGRASEAAKAFEMALKELPRNGWALWGLWQARKAMGDARMAEPQAAFEKAWLGDSTMLDLKRV